MSKFQKGDKVRCVSKEHTKRYWNEHVKYLEIGRVYTVSYVDSPYDYRVTLQEVDTIEPDGLFTTKTISFQPFVQTKLGIER